MSIEKQIKLLHKKIDNHEESISLLLELIQSHIAYCRHNYDLIKRFHNVARKRGEKK